MQKPRDFHAGPITEPHRHPDLPAGSTDAPMSSVAIFMAGVDADMRVLQNHARTRELGDVMMVSVRSGPVDIAEISVRTRSEMRFK